MPNWATFPVILNAVPIMKGLEPVGILGIMTDISERKSNEMALLAATQAAVRRTYANVQVVKSDVPPDPAGRSRIPIERYTLQRFHVLHPLKCAGIIDMLGYEVKRRGT